MWPGVGEGVSIAVHFIRPLAALDDLTQFGGGRKEGGVTNV